VAYRECTLNFNLKIGMEPPLGRPMSRLKDNINTDLKRNGMCGLDLSGSGYEPWQALVNMVMNLQVT
jgi:hypothetical protein